MTEAKENDQAFNNAAAHWIGFMYRALYIQTGVASAILAEKIPLSYMYAAYPGLHTVAKEDAVEELRKNIIRISEIRAVPFGAVFICEENRHILDSILMIRRKSIYGSYFLLKNRAERRQIMDRHWYGILPNGEAYMVNWFTKLKNGDICMVPASSDKYRFGSEEPLETASAKAANIAGKDYDVVLYKRMAEMPSQNGYYHFKPERYLVNNKNVLGDLKGEDND